MINYTLAENDALCFADLRYHSITWNNAIVDNMFTLNWDN